MKSREELLQGLNEQQLEAVRHTGSDSLILAGAGAGKTKVLTTKIAYLLTQGVAPFQVMALTFTNKAAREMRSRIGDLVGAELARFITVGTFHSVFSRFLRSYAQNLGYSDNYTIYDTTDSRSLIKIICKEFKLDDKVYKPNTIQGLISSAKNDGFTPSELAEDMLRNRHFLQKSFPMLPEVYRSYEEHCKRANAMDFDDLLLNMLRLLQNFPQIREVFHERYEYILVDEYQDTNRVQHRIVSLLKGPHTELTVVGDDAQSIYSFRGAVIDNIINFQKTFTGSTLFKLTKNYRSTGNIVKLANGLISKNKWRIPKTVESVAGEGDKTLLFESFNGAMEAQQVSAQVKKLISDGISPEEIAVLYRTNAQSRLMEQNLKMFNIPMRVYGGLSFFDRKEVKDVLAYLRLVINPQDDEAFRRIYNTPARRIGPTTFEGLAKIASSHQLPLMSTLHKPELLSEEIKPKGIDNLQQFAKLITLLTEIQDELEPVDYLKRVIELSGLKSMYNDGTVEGQSKIDNISELVSALNDFVDRNEESRGETPTLEEFVREMSLYTDQDTAEDDLPKVTLMTMHASKGLEFGHIFCIGLEEGLIPNARSVGQAEIEEERRLFYVAITRAKERCTLSYARERTLNGQTNMTSPSRFLKDLDPQYIKDNTGLLSGSIKQKLQEKFREIHSDLPTPKRRVLRIKRDRQVGVDGIGKNSEMPLSSNAPEADFVEGDIVYHSNFGRGEVMGFSDSISGVKAIIKFSDGQVRQLILKFAKLRKA